MYIFVFSQNKNMRKLFFFFLGLAFAIVVTHNGCKHEPLEYIPPGPLSLVEVQVACGVLSAIIY
jgi:hypothetical protein